MSEYSIQHRCLQNRAGIPETFYEHSWIEARDGREAKKIAGRIPLDSRCRKLTKITQIAPSWTGV